MARRVDVILSHFVPGAVGKVGKKARATFLEVNAAGRDAKLLRELADDVFAAEREVDLVRLACAVRQLDHQGGHEGLQLHTAV